MNQKQGAMVGERGDVWPIGALAPYGLTPPLHVVPLAAGAGINNQVRVVRTGAGQFLWKHLTHADPAHILAEHGLLGWLAGANLPFGTPQPLATAPRATDSPPPAAVAMRSSAGSPANRSHAATRPRSRRWGRRSGCSTARWPRCPSTSARPGRRMGRWPRSIRACPIRPR